MKQLGIIGFGWLGNHIADFFFKKNYKILATTTSDSKIAYIQEKNYIPILINFSDNELINFEANDLIPHCDALLICIPFSRNIDVKALINRYENLSRFIGKFQKQIFLMSSTGIYPQKKMIITEVNMSDEELNQSFWQIERMMQTKYSQINILRLAGLTGGTRKFGNYKVSEPEQPVNQIHYTDICHIIEKMMEFNINDKTYNLVAPMHPSKQEIIDYQTNKPNSFPNYADISGRIISGEKLQKELNYQYKYPNPVFFP